MWLLGCTERATSQKTSRGQSTVIAALLFVVLAWFGLGCAQSNGVDGSTNASSNQQINASEAETNSAEIQPTQTQQAQTQQAQTESFAATTNAIPTTPPLQPIQDSTTPDPTEESATSQNEAAGEPGTPKADNTNSGDPLGQAAPQPTTAKAPPVPATAIELAQALNHAETVLRDPQTTTEQKSRAGHLHQLCIRKLGLHPELDTEVFETLDPAFAETTRQHLIARRSLLNMHLGYGEIDFVPAWQIIEPETQEALVSYYKEAETNTGISWEYLAAINLVETGMGRIHGLSSAGAKGPMQFLQTTWDEAGIGSGDIEKPQDAIAAAARYLVRRGGPNDMQKALWGYNNSDNYVVAVSAYAQLLKDDPAAFGAIYNWEIYFSTRLGDVWLPVGTFIGETTPLEEFLQNNPNSQPHPELAKTTE